MKNILLLIIFILVFSTPRSLQEVKIFLFGVLFMVSFKPIIKKSFILISLLYVSIFLIPFLLGIFYNNSFTNIWPILKLNIFFPILLLFILQNFTINSIFDNLYKSSVISIIIITLITLTTILNGLNLFPINLNLIFYPNETALRLEGGYIQIINSSLSYLLFIIPIFFYDLNKLKDSPRKSIFFLFLLLLAFISGRRILLLPFIIIVVKNFKSIILPFSLIILTLFLIEDNDFFNKEVITNRFYDAINSEGDSYIRQEQSNEFLYYIKKRPFFGYGTGSYMKSLIRNEDFPTAYERTFYYLLFSMGIIFFFLLFLFYTLLIYFFQKNNDLSIEQKVSFILSIISLLIASITNPYWMSSFDYIIPLAIMMRFAQDKFNPIYFKKYKLT